MFHLHLLFSGQQVPIVDQSILSAGVFYDNMHILQLMNLVNVDVSLVMTYLQSVISSSCSRCSPWMIHKTSVDSYLHFKMEIISTDMVETFICLYT